MLEVGMFLVDRYEILAKIGAGGMADVYKAKDHILDRVVAIKVLKPEFSEDVNFVTKFRTEAQSAGRLEHPNIVNIYDVGSENGLHFIVMEHVEGITLKTYIEKKGQLSFKEATSIAIQVARGIEIAHSKEIIHRDIKPQNIIISTEGKVKVTDFGIAKASSSNTISADVMGSVHYASPEQTRNGYVDGRSDIYSLGIVMYEMVTGRVPFDGDTTVAVALQHLQEEMVGPSVYAPELPISYEKIVLKCTQKNPDRRYQIIEELLADLRKALVTPDEDFVVIAPLPAAVKTRIIGSEELAQIQKGAKDADLDQETHYVEGSEEDIDGENDEEYDEDEEEDAGFLNPKVEKFLTYVGIGVLALIIGLCIYFVILISNLGDGGKKPNTQNSQKNTESQSESESEPETEELIKMIDIIGMSVEEAEEELEERGLELNIVTYQESSKADGTILGQDPEEGEMIEKGTTIDVIVAGDTSTTIPVPDVLTLEESAAEKAITDKGFKVRKEYANSDDVEKGYVISQSPEYGQKGAQGSYVTIIISNGPENAKVPTLRDFRNMTIDEVTEELEELGFAVNVKEEYSDQYDEGEIFKVESEGKDVAGEEIAYGSTVDVYVSKGEAPEISYEVTFDFASEIAKDGQLEDAIAYRYILTINGEVVEEISEKASPLRIKEFPTYTYNSKAEFESAKLEVYWFKAEENTQVKPPSSDIEEGGSVDGTENVEASEETIQSTYFKKKTYTLIPVEKEISPEE